MALLAYAAFRGMDPQMSMLIGGAVGFLIGTKAKNGHPKP